MADAKETVYSLMKISMCMLTNLELLSQIRKLSEVELDMSLRLHTVPTLGELSKTSEEKPWETPKMDMTQTDCYPKEIVLTRANMLYIPLTSLSAKCVNVFKRMAAFRNPEFYEKQGMRLSTYNIPRIISCSEITDDYLVLPRGCEDAVRAILTQHNVKVLISDKTNHGRKYKGYIQRRSSRTAKGNGSFCWA